MKTKKFFATAIAAVVAIAIACVPAWLGYTAWSWIIDQVPIANEWAGLIKIGITVVLLALFGPATIAVTLLLVTFLTALFVAFLE